MTIRIAMWSGPRNISTAMMRSFENRADCTVVDSIRSRQRPPPASSASKRVSEYLRPVRRVSTRWTPVRSVTVTWMRTLLTAA